MYTHRLIFQFHHTTEESELLHQTCERQNQQSIHQNKHLYQICNEVGAVIKFIPLSENGELLPQNLELVMSSLNNLKSANLKGMLIHSDQGCLYSSTEYKKFIKDHQIIQSMSRKANCWDNSCIEHFFGTLKVESGYNKTLKTSFL